MEERFVSALPDITSLSQINIANYSIPRVPVHLNLILTAKGVLKLNFIHINSVKNTACIPKMAMGVINKECIGPFRSDLFDKTGIRGFNGLLLCHFQLAGGRDI